MQTRIWKSKLLTDVHRIFFSGWSCAIFNSGLKKEGFKNCTCLKEVICYAITIVLNRKRAAVTGSYS